MKRPTVLFLAAILAMVPFPVFAAGLITALTASANPAPVNTDVTFTVKGTGGGCGDLTIDFGDGQTTQLVSVSFNNNTNTTTPAHKYAVAKTYAVKAIPGRSCTGAATVNLVVTSATGGGTGGGLGTGGLYNQVARDKAHLYMNLITPRIDTVFPFSIIRPGGGVIVQGEHFGTAPGRFQLKLAGGLATDLTRLEWGDKAIGGTIDPGISTVVDQPGMLQVIRSNGQTSNEVPVSFTARREIRELPMVDLHADCSQGSDRNKCNFEPSSASMEAWHGCTGIYFSCSDAGKDEYWANLANGWRYSSASVTVGYARADQALILQDEPGAFRLSVYWDTEGHHFATYYGRVYVEGPAGTSWK